MNNIIEQYYLDNNYPAADKLYKILKNNGHSIPLSKIKEWLAKQQTEQIMKPVKKTSTGHFVAYKKMNFGILIYMTYQNTINITRVTNIFFVQLTYLQEKYTV